MKILIMKLIATKKLIALITYIVFIVFIVYIVYDLLAARQCEVSAPTLPPTIPPPSEADVANVPEILILR